MVFIKRTAFICFVMLFALMARSALAEVRVFTDRASFEIRLDATSIITDDYEDPGYTTGDIEDTVSLDRFSEAAMNAVLGETKYIATNPAKFTPIVFENPFIPGNRFYCTGCNGTFTLDFTSTSAGDATGVFGVGFFPQTSRRSVDPFQFAIATVTFGDGSTQDYTLPTQMFFGIIADKKIKSIHIGGPGGTDVAINFLFTMDDLTIGSKGAIPPLSLVVNTTDSGFDADPGDGVCETAMGNGVCTLRAAIMETNAWPGKDTITLAGGLYAPEFVTDIFINLCGFPIFLIEDDVKIIGDNLNLPILSGDQFFFPRVIFCVAGGASVEISNMKMRNASAGITVLQGGTANLDTIFITGMLQVGLRNLGVMDIIHSSINQNKIGIKNQGALTLIESAVFENSNSSFDEGAGIVNFRNSIFSDPIPELVIERSSIYANESILEGGGILNRSGIVEIRDSSIIDNRSECFGGGIASLGFDIQFTIVNSIINANRTTDEFARSIACSGDRDGGGIYFSGGNIHIINSRICQNQAVGKGGGINSFTKNTIIEDSTICQNTARDGGGGLVVVGGRYRTVEQGQDRFLMTGSTVRDNISTDDGTDIARNKGGGGLFMRVREISSSIPEGFIAPELRIRNSTFSGNQSLQVEGGAIRISVFQGGSSNVSPIPLIIENSTIANNTAVTGSALSGPADISNTIVADNFLGDDCGPDVNGVSNQDVKSFGHNLDSDGTCNLNPLISDLPNTDPLLGPLFRNAGLTGTFSHTSTHALVFPSPAIDGGEDKIAPLLDQRGLSRIGQSDIGAYEWFATVDGDQDGILNNVDLAPASFSNDFSDVANGGSSHGTITNRGFFGFLLEFHVEDAAAPEDGVVISATGVGTGTLSLCGSSLTAFITAGDVWIVTCGSLGAWVLEGEIEIALTDTVDLILPQYARVTIDEDEDGNTVVRNQINSSVTATLEVDGFEVPLPAGSAVTLGGCAGDANGDGAMTPRDIAAVARAIPSTPADPRWNPDADINGDGRIDKLDLALARGSFLDPSCLRGPGTAPPNGLPSASQH